MSKRIKCTLSSESIRNAIKQLETYQNRLQDKNEIFVQRLAELGIPVIDENIALAQGDSDKTTIPTSKSTGLEAMHGQLLCARVLT